MLNIKQSQWWGLANQQAWKEEAELKEFSVSLTCTWYCDVSCMMTLEFEYFFRCSERNKNANKTHYIHRLPRGKRRYLEFLLCKVIFWQTNI